MEKQELTNLMSSIDGLSADNKVRLISQCVMDGVIAVPVAMGMRSIFNTHFVNGTGYDRFPFLSSYTQDDVNEFTSVIMDMLNKKFSDNPGSEAFCEEGTEALGKIFNKISADFPSPSALPTP